ncbi:MAG: GMC family oxidoreductase [Myxococcota bacterium]
MQVLTESEARLVRQLGQAAFPRDTSDIPDGIDADVVGYVDTLLHESMPFERAQIRALFQLFDKGFTVWSANPRARLATASLEDVGDYLRTWEESNLYARRMAHEGIRSLLLMAWFGSQKVSEVLGILEAEDLDVPLDTTPKPTAEARAALDARFMARPDGLMEFEDYGGSVQETCDVVVVGSGPGGALVALELARAGKRVILVEAGPVARKADLVRDGGLTMARYFWDSGMRTTRGNVILPTMQAKLLGGGSVVNSAICLRALDSALEAWADDWGVEGHSAEELAPHYDFVESFMGIRDVADDVMGPRNDLFAQACSNLGLEATRIRRNEDGCLGSAACLYGCPNGAKLSTDRRGVPELLEAGGRVLTSIHVDEVLVRHGVATGISGHISEPFTARDAGPVKIFAKAVVLAAGVIHTPVIAQRSGLTASPIGSNLLMHPSTMVSGQLADDVMPWFGATQGYHSLSLLDYGIKLESLWADPALMAFRMQGIGKGLKRQLAQYRHIATWDAWVSGDDSVGRVRWVRGSPRPSITYDIGHGDMRRLQEATAVLSEMLFSVGATKVFPGIHGLAPTLTDPSDVASIRAARLEPQDLPSGSNHVFGTMPMGDDPERAATGSDYSVHGVEGLYVSDTSLFPTSPGVNPMLTAMALGHRLGGILSERL